VNAHLNGGARVVNTEQKCFWFTVVIFASVRLAADATAARADAAADAASVSGYPLVNGHVLQQMRLLPEGLAAVLALEGLLPRVRAQMHLDVGLVEEAAVADLAVVHDLLPVGVQLLRGGRGAAAAPGHGG